MNIFNIFKYFNFTLQHIQNTKITLICFSFLKHRCSSAVKLIIHQQILVNTLCTYSLESACCMYNSLESACCMYNSLESECCMYNSLESVCCMYNSLESVCCMYNSVESVCCMYNSLEFVCCIYSSLESVCCMYNSLESVQFFGICILYAGTH